MKKFESAVIIGFGSIGRRHYEILKNLNIFNKIFIFTKQKISKKKNIIHELNDLKKINPSYILICNETSKHFKTLRFLTKNFKGKTIFIEKPLFERSYDLKNFKNNYIFVGYNFRYHPIITYIKKVLLNKKILTSQILCGSYLPYWRKNISYNKSYSSDKKKGGGVLLDLSHEIDYVFWLYGKIKLCYSDYKKISNLNISSKDSTFIIGNNSKVKKIFISLDYFSLTAKRQIYIESDNFSLHCDLIKNSIIHKSKDKIKKIKFNKKTLDQTYVNQHKNILLDKKKIACTYQEALNVIKFIDKIKNEK